MRWRAYVYHHENRYGDDAYVIAFERNIRLQSTSYLSRTPRTEGHT